MTKHGEMRFARYRHAGAVHLGVLDGEDLLAVPGFDDLLPLLGLPDGLDEAADAARRHGTGAPVDDVMLLAPLACPPTVRDFYAFERHVAAGRRARGLDMDPTWYELPVFYFTNPYAVRGPGVVPMPPGTERFDFELEVAAIVGAGGRDLDADEAEAAIAGYAVLNDWSARDIQAREMRLNLGPAKGKDTATGLGPWFVTADELAGRRRGKGFDLTMTATVNGREYSRDSWSDVYWSFGEMISYASQGTEVRPGDVIGSGTCGTGCILELSLTHGEDAYPWLVAGDVVVAGVELLGEHEATVVAYGSDDYDGGGNAPPGGGAVW